MQPQSGSIPQNGHVQSISPLSRSGAHLSTVSLEKAKATLCEEPRDVHDSQMCTGGGQAGEEARMTSLSQQGDSLGHEEAQVIRWGRTCCPLGEHPCNPKELLLVRVGKNYFGETKSAKQTVSAMENCYFKVLAAAWRGTLHILQKSHIPLDNAIQRERCKQDI